MRLPGSDAASRVQVTPVGLGAQPAQLVVALSLRPVEDAVRRVLLLVLVAGPGVLAATALGAYGLVRRGLRPAQELVGQAGRIGSDRLDERVAVPDGSEEVRSLARTLNAMLDRIEQGVVARRRLVADASHELRTPLAVMRAEVDVSLRSDRLPEPAQEVLRSVGEEVDGMSRTVDNLLALAQVEEGRLELLTAPIDLRQAVEEAVRPLRGLAAAQDVALVTDGEAVEVRADPRSLRLVLTNLVDNALKFTPGGGCVQVTSWQRDGVAGVTVADDGPGIAEPDRERVFERFARAGSAATDVRGSGLGLAICRSVALAHGGRLLLDTAPAGAAPSRSSCPRRGA